MLAVAITLNVLAVAVKLSNMLAVAIRPSLDRTSDVTIPTRVYYKDTTTSFNTLLDTGALQGN